MSLNSEDISKVSYKANIEWFKQRIYEISDGQLTLQDYVKNKNTDFETVTHTPDELISILNDLKSKANKLNDKIEFLCGSTVIPVDKDKAPELAQAIASIDKTSAGSYVSYKLYNDLLKEQEYVNNKVSLDYVVSNYTGDAQADSAMIQDGIYQAYASYPGGTEPDNSQTKMYANRWLNGVFSWNEHDYKVRQILNFSDNYIDMSPDPAYIPWSMRRDVGESAVESGNMADMWKHYSTSFASNMSEYVKDVGGLGALRPDPTIHDLTTRYITYANTFLNQANAVFDQKWAVDLICCFMQWGIRLDIKTLKGLRALLQLMQMNLIIDFTDVLNGLKDVINNIFRGLLYNQLVGLINQMIQRIVDPIKKWLQNPDGDVWKKVLACTPIATLINGYINQAVADIESRLYKLISKWYKKIELQNIKNSLKININTHKKWMGELAKLLDSIIAVAERAATCGLAGSPNSDVVPQIVANYNIGSDTSYRFPDDANPTIYNSFIPSNPVASSADSSSPTQTAQLETGAVGGQVSVNGTMKLSDCLKKMPIDGISGVQDWMLAPQTNV
jgi:hypothetical protein